jgi:ABC-type transport system involved in cytochrome c biogenesis permease subunit
MTPLEFLVPLGALESVAGVLPYVILVLVLGSFLTRHRAHQTHKRAADDGVDAVERYTPHSALSIVLVLVSFLYMVVRPHGGMVISVLVLGMVVADFFEFEARLVEVRNDMELEAPKSAIGASVLALTYAAFQALFWIIKEPWEMII